MSSIRFRLFLMMVLQFFIWGAWLPLIFGYLPSLGFTSLQQSLILNTFPIAAIVGMFFSNQFADRNFAAERFLAFSHLVGGLAMLGLSQVTTFWPFFGLMLLHCLFYVPTISITNSIAFANVRDAQKEFGMIRVGGTIGWIMAAWPFVFLFSGLKGEELQRATSWTYIVAGLASLVLAAYSVTLPHTPPKPAAKGESSLAWLEAMKLLALPFLFVLWVVTFADAAVHQCFFSWTERFLKDRVGIPGNWIMPVMSISQVAEILAMFVLGPCLKALGWRVTMVVGILGHAIRFAVFAYCPDYPWLVVVINVMHGVCYAFFFATVYIFVDEYFPKDIRSSAQGLFNLMILGLGPLVANFVCPWLFDQEFSHVAGIDLKAGPLVITDYRGLFLVPCVTALAAALALALFFYPPRKAAVPDEAIPGPKAAISPEEVA